VKSSGGSSLLSEIDKESGGGSGEGGRSSGGNTVTCELPEKFPNEGDLVRSSTSSSEGLEISSWQDR
jgi:hypothetical protein